MERQIIVQSVFFTTNRFLLTEPCKIVNCCIKERFFNTDEILHFYIKRMPNNVCKNDIHVKDYAVFKSKTNKKMYT